MLATLHWKYELCSLLCFHLQNRIVTKSFKNMGYCQKPGRCSWTVKYISNTDGVNTILVITELDQNVTGVVNVDHASSHPALCDIRQFMETNKV